MKEERELSGIYFRFRNPENGKWENRCFEDLPDENQDEILLAHNQEWVMSLAKSLAKTLYEIAEQFGITKREKDEDAQ